MEVKKWWVFVIIFVFVLAVYLIFFYAKSCYNSACFEEALRKCNRMSYDNNAEEAVWHYQIKGKAYGEFRKSCRVNVELVQIKEGSIDMLEMQGKDMDCYLPLGVVESPEEDLLRCHGRLREEMQNIIIQKSHAYIFENLGKISEELEKVI